MTDQNGPVTPDPANPPQDAATPEAGASQPAAGAPGVSVTMTPGNDATGTQIASEIKNITNYYQLEASLESTRQLNDAVASLISNFAQRPDTAAPRTPPPENMPDTDEAVSEWFCKSLTLTERCQVRATAILHGAPAHLVSRAAMELQESFLRPKQDKAGSEQPPAQPEVDMSGPILERAFVTIRKAGNARRVYWKDADSEGYSPFGLRVLRLLSGEIEGTAGFRSENSLRMIEAWVVSGEGELAQRAAYALGAIWWDMDGRGLTDRARNWAESSIRAERANAPLLALGAFAAEWSSVLPEERKAKSTLETQRMLDRFSALALRNVKLTPLAIAVSTAYSIIGLEWTQQALDGLDYLLGLDVSRDDDAPDVIPFPVCLPGIVAYTQLAAAGLVRPALARLGIRARMLSRHPKAPAYSEEAKRRERRRKDRLFNTHLAFFFILAASRPATRRKWPHYGQQARIEEKPKLEHNNDGRDVLLDGALSEQEHDLSMDVQSLFWSSLTSDTHEVAHETLRQWVEAIATTSADPEDPSVVRGRAFFISLAARMQAWDSAEQSSGPTSATERYRRYFTQWAGLRGTETNLAISRFAQRILLDFPFVSGKV